MRTVVNVPIMRWHALGIVLVMAATLRAATNEANSSAPALATERTKLLAVDQEFSKMAVAEGTQAAFGKYSAEEVTLLPMGQAPVVGRAAASEFLTKTPKGTLSWTPEQAEVSTSGDLGYTWGTYKFRSADTNGVERIDYGKYVTTWRKQPDGNWKFTVDIDNRSPAPAKPTGN